MRSLLRRLRFRNLPKIGGSLDAYEFYVWFALHYHCEDCGAHMECPVGDEDVTAPEPPWSTREGRRGMALGWYVPPLTSHGSLLPLSLCPTCAKRLGLRIASSEARQPA